VNAIHPINSNPMLLKIFSVSYGFVLKRPITLSAIIRGDKNPRLKRKVETVNVQSGSKMLLAREKSNRKLWEDECLRNEKLSGLLPTSNVYFTEFYEEKRYSLEECILMHREFANPDMLNCPEAELNLDITLNMRTQKNNKFVSKIQTIVVLPHELTFLPKKKCFSFLY